MSSSIRLLGFFLSFGAAQFAQQRQLDLSHTYERVLAVVPMIGQGTWEDPKRPMFTPLPSQMKTGDRSGILAFQFVASDDGKNALVEFVFQDRAALKAVMANLTAQSSVKAFDKGKETSAAIETVFKTFKKDFDISKFAVRVP